MRYFIVALLAIGCASTGAKIDDLCIPGQIREESADWLNAHKETWKQHGDYEQPIKSGDRLLNGDCSEVLKSAGKKDASGVWGAVKKVIGL